MAKRRPLRGKKLLIASAGFAALGAVGCDDGDTGTNALPPTVEEAPVVGNLVAPPQTEVIEQETDVVEQETDVVEAEVEDPPTPEAEAEPAPDVAPEEPPAPRRPLMPRRPRIEDIGPVGNLVAPPPPPVPTPRGKR